MSPEAAADLADLAEEMRRQDNLATRASGRISR